MNIVVLAHRLMHDVVEGGDRWGGGRCLLVDTTGRAPAFRAEGPWFDPCWGQQDKGKQVHMSFGEERMAEWYWTLNHELMGSSPAIH